MRQSGLLIIACVSMLVTAFSQAEDLSQQPGYLNAEYIFETSPFPSCHASTIVQTSDGTLVAAWFGGTAEKNPDVGIWLSRKAEGKWTAPVEMANGVQSSSKRFPCWNPVLFQPANNDLILFYKVGPSPRTWWGMLKRSSDGGKTWTESEKLPDGFLGPIKNKPVQLQNGKLLCPTSSEHEGWRVHFEMTADLGKTWTKTNPLNDGKQIQAIQPSILFHPQSRLQALGRTRQGQIWEAWSKDLGISWEPVKLIQLPNPNAGTDAVTLKDGRHLLVYNHTKKGRSPLNVAVSNDGVQWLAAIVLENKPGEYSYPAVIQTNEGFVHIVYTFQRKKIRHVVINPKSLQLKPIDNGKWPK